MSRTTLTVAVTAAHSQPGPGAANHSTSSIPPARGGRGKTTRRHRWNDPGSHRPCAPRAGAHGQFTPEGHRQPRTACHLPRVAGSPGCRSGSGCRDEREGAGYGHRRGSLTLADGRTRTISPSITRHEGHHGVDRFSGAVGQSRRASGTTVHSQAAKPGWYTAGMSTGGTTWSGTGQAWRRRHRRSGIGATWAAYQSDIAGSSWCTPVSGSPWARRVLLGGQSPRRTQTEGSDGGEMAAAPVSAARQRTVGVGQESTRRCRSARQASAAAMIRAEGGISWRARPG